MDVVVSTYFRVVVLVSGRGECSRHRYTEKDETLHLCDPMTLLQGLTHLACREQRLYQCHALGRGPSTRIEALSNRFELLHGRSIRLGRTE